jgi:hypothetical protein
MQTNNDNRFGVSPPSPMRGMAQSSVEQSSIIAVAAAAPGKQ